MIENRKKIQGLNRLIFSLSKNLIPDAISTFFELGPSYLHQADLLTIPWRLRGQIGKKCTLRPLRGTPKGTPPGALWVDPLFVIQSCSDLKHRCIFGGPPRGLRMHFLPIWPCSLRGMVKRSAWCEYEGPSSKNAKMASGIRFLWQAEEITIQSFIPQGRRNRGGQGGH